MTDAADWIRALHGSHDRFAKLLAPLDDDAVAGRSYADEWSIAQVASHLGSQAEIFGMFLDAALAGEPAPGQEIFQPIWDGWNSRTPRAQVDDSVQADARFVARVEGLTEAQRAGFSLSMFDNHYDLAGFISMRLGEHALHTWDIAVALDPTALVAPDAVELLVDTPTVMASWIGKPEEVGRTVVVETVDPQRTFALTTGPDVALVAGSGAADLRLPAEAFIRLVFGRLDPKHAPAELADNALVADLRVVFPGF
ncbi:MAG TPA: maleylpyruvate isomerase family mycothiol-dependent enzyme [Pseudonocardiaceae bacterium]|jgi:uncharacterized protein (TIGR03083 family)|nr:maleylpyruvate isomerase family mycothiol-dependent enzyme [Pseudonocardiaceae bacterium]